MPGGASARAGQSTISHHSHSIKFRQQAAERDALAITEAISRIDMEQATATVICNRFKQKGLAIGNLNGKEEICTFWHNRFGNSEESRNEVEQIWEKASQEAKTEKTNLQKSLNLDGDMKE
ncbi:hypothetical protein ACFL2V_17165 [Pseudomonadota bacterium]